MATERVPPPQRGSDRQILAGTLDHMRTAIVREAEVIDGTRGQ
jgi:hypothetical protein